MGPPGLIVSTSRFSVIVDLINCGRDFPERAACPEYQVKRENVAQLDW